MRVLQVVGKKFGHYFQFRERLIGSAAIEQEGTPLSADTLSVCRSADAVLLGAVGGPRWDDPMAQVRPEQGLLSLRKGLGVFANLRPVSVHPALASLSPLKAEKLAGVDILVVRELTGGLYFGQPRGREVRNGQMHAVDTLEYAEDEICRIVDLAFRLAQGRRRIVTSVDKANVLESSRLWRQVAESVGAKYPEVTLEHLLVDTAAMKLVSNPVQYDILVTENMFGDILTDEASVLVGSMGMLPSASLGEKGPGLYEPIHGSAPDIAGKGIANPVGAILSAGLLLRYSLHLEKEAQVVESAVYQAITQGNGTVDIGGSLSTQEMGEAIINFL